MIRLISPVLPLREGCSGRRSEQRGSGRALFLLIHAMVALLSSAILGIRHSAADPEKRDLEHLVFEDCGTARMMIGHLPPAELEKGLITLVSTIRLGVGGAAYPGTAPSQLGGTGTPKIPGHGELAGDIVLLSLDPGRNERARRCSIELLRTFLPSRPVVLRELINLAEDPDLVGADRALVEELRRIVFSIAEEAAPHMSRGDAVLLLDPLIREQPGILLNRWQPLLRFFPLDSLNLIGRKYLTSPDFDPTLLDLLAAIDPSGEMGIKLIEDTFYSRDDGTRRARTLAWMQKVRLPTERVMRLLLSELATGSGEILPDILQTLAARVPSGGSRGRACLPRFDPDAFTISSVIAAVSARWVVMEEESRTGASGIRCTPQCEVESEQTGLSALWCDRQALSRYRTIIDELVRSDSPLLGTSWPAIASLSLWSTELEHYLRQSLNSSHRSVRVAAFALYSRQPRDRGKFVSDALRLIKRPAVIEDEKRELIEQLAYSFVSAPVGIRGLPAVPLFLDSFDRPLSECGLLCGEDGGRGPLVARAIGAVGKDAFPLLVRSLESSKDQRRRLALLTLGELSPIDERMAHFLVAGLRDSEVELRDLSQQLVMRHRSEIPVRNELTRALRWSDAEAIGRVSVLLKQ